MDKPAASAWKTSRIVGVIGCIAGALALAWFLFGPQAPSGPAAPVPTAASTAGKERAMQLLMALPELKAWSTQLEKSSGGKVHGAVIEYDPAPKIVDGKSYWQFSFVENSADSAHRWESFLVSVSGDVILVEDPATDKLLSVEQWRTTRHPMERTSADGG